MTPSTRTLTTSVNGAVTVPTRIQKWSVAEPPAGIVTVWPRVAVSGAGMPPNQSQKPPVRGGEAPPPVPHEGTSQSGVPKLVEVSVGQNVFGIPPFSNPPSAITSLLQGVPLGEAVALGVAVAEAVAVGVGVAGVAVGVGVGVPGVTVGLGVGVAQMPVVLMLKLHPPEMVPTSPPRSSTT